MMLAWMTLPNSGQAVILTQTLLIGHDLSFECCTPDPDAMKNAGPFSLGDDDTVLISSVRQGHVPCQ